MIAFITTSLGWGGTEGHVTDLATGYVRRGVCPIVIVDHPPLDRIESLNRAGVRTEVLSDNGMLLPSQYKKVLTKLLKDTKATLLHINSWERRPSILEAAKDAGIPAIETLHQTVPFKARHKFMISRHPLSMWKGIRIYRKAKPAVINISNISNDNFIKKYPFIKKTRRIYCGAYLPAKPNDVYSSGKSATVLWIGSLIERKRPIFALEIWKKITSYCPGSQLVIVGDGPERGIVKDTIRNYGNDTVSFYRNVNDLHPLLKRADVMLHTSTAEGIPKNIRYATNFGIPIVSTDVGAISEAVIDGENGFLTSINDSYLMEYRLRQLLDDPILRKKMGTIGRQIGEQLFNLEDMIDNVLIAYRDLCGVEIVTKNPSDDNINHIILD